MSAPQNPLSLFNRSPIRGCSRRKLHAIGLLFLLMTLLLSSFAAASPGSLDSSFNVGTSSTGNINTVLLQPDGKVIIAGVFSYYRSVLRPGIARLNADASVDLSFDAGSLVGSSSVNAGYLYPDGTILIAGSFSSGGRSRIARLTANGAIDPSFDPGAGPNGEITCLALQPDGKIVIGGRFTSFAGQAAARLARLNADGSLDSGFTPSADNTVNAVALQPDGKIMVAGWFWHMNGSARADVARLHPDGTLDTSFISTLNNFVACLALQPDGSILVGGNLKFTHGATVERLMPDGSWDPGFSAAVGQSVRELQLQGDGKILVGGTFTAVNGDSRSYIARLYSDGSTDPSFLAAIDNEVRVIEIQPDGKFVIAGGFGEVEGIDESGLARLNGDDTAATPMIEFNGASFKALQGDPSITVPVYRGGNTNATVSVQYATADLEAQAGSDYGATAGTLSFAPGEIAKSITVLLFNDGAATIAERFAVYLSSPVGAVLSTKTNATVTVVGVNPAVEIVTPDIDTHELGGELTITLARAGTNLETSVQCQTVDGTAVAGVNFSNLVQTVTFAAGQLTNTVIVRLLDNDQPGPDTSFTVQLSNPVNATIGTRSNLTVWIRENDAPGHPARGVDGGVWAVAPTPDGRVLLAGGFLTINGLPRSGVGIVRTDGAVDETFVPGAGCDGRVDGALAQADGKIVCSGSFTSFDGVPRGRVVRLKPDGSLDSTFNPGAGADKTVLAVVPAGDGGYFVGGGFTKFGGVVRPAIAKLNSDGTLNTNFVPQLPAGFDPALCLAVQADGKLLAGTYNFVVGTNFVLRLKADGSRDPSFTNRLTASPDSAMVYAIVPQPDGKILVGGYLYRRGLARLNSDGTLDSTFATGSGISGGLVYKLLLLTNGQIMAVGSFSGYAGASRDGIARINANGSIDSSFDPQLGADAEIEDIAPLPGGRWAVGGLFHRLAGLPRYHFAILDSAGHVISRVEFESLAVGSDVRLGLVVEPEAPFQVLRSSNMVNWQIAYTNWIFQGFTNLPLPRVEGERQFFRILQTPSPGR